MEMEPSKPISIGTSLDSTVTSFPAAADGPLPQPAERRRALHHALIQIQNEAADLGMPLASHLAGAAAEAASEESR
jgi:hypothetical protein